MYVVIHGSGLEGHVSVKIRRIRNFQYSWVPTEPGTRWWHTHRAKEAETLYPREQDV